MSLILNRRLEEAEEALHQLNMGKRVVRFVDQNGESVEYRAGSATELAAYIADLRRQLSGRLNTGPATAFF